MTAFLTGGSGFVGGALLRRLVGGGTKVVAAVRSPAAASAVRLLGARAIEVDLADVDSTAAAMRGCEVVFHVAGVNRLCPRHEATLHAGNVDLPASVVRAAARAGVGRVVHTSSAATLGEEAGTVGREDSPHRGWFLSPYERTKYLGERTAFALGRELGIDVVSVNPSSVQGPGRETGTGRLFLRIASARTAVLFRTWISVLDVDDCAEGHVLAAERGRPGERYVLCGASLPMAEAVELLRSRTGRPERVVWIPRAVMRASVPVAALVARLFRGEDPPVCPAAIRTLLHGHRYDGSRAAEELGLRTTPIEATLKKTLAWAAERRMLPPVAPT
ncbi:MAG: NAD-dependent epimerase/dehydratase family protein [Planctomycetaceae bacterium]